VKAIIKLEHIVSNAIHQLESSLIQFPSNVKDVLKALNSVLALNHVNVTVPPQEASIQPQKHVNALEGKYSLTINVNVLKINLFGMVKDVLPVLPELPLNHKINNVIIVHKDSLQTQ